jgi:hypothetical protein
MKTEQQRLPRFAVLIDADNTSAQIAGGLFEEVAKFGEASVRRIYGDFPISGSNPGPTFSRNTRSIPINNLPTRRERTPPTSRW